MNVELLVRVNGMYWKGSAAFKVPELHEQAFEPLKTGDDPLLMYVFNEKPVHEVRIVMKTRADAAEILAKELAKHIVHEMKKHDTHNGYRDDDKYKCTELSK